jgi:Fe-S-cluster containining protein
MKGIAELLETLFAPTRIIRPEEPKPIDAAPFAVPPFQRTVCACHKCAEHCHEQPGSCAPGDVERIADFLGKSTSQITHLFRSSPGTTVLDLLAGTETTIHTIVPATVKGSAGRCVFLDEDNRCSIHPVAPFGCAMYDDHMNYKECDRRSKWMVREVMRSLTYPILRDSLEPATTYNPRSKGHMRRLVELVKK